jgi:FK506-binding nuclear protein
MSDLAFEDLDEHSKKIVKVRMIMRDRENARKSNDFGKSDSLREKLKDEYGVDVLDQKGGPSGWKFVDGSTRKLKAGTKVPAKAEKKRNREDAADVPSAADKKKAEKEKLKKQKVDKKDSDEVDRNKAAAKKMSSPSGGASGTRTVNGVLIEDISIGKGKEAKSGNKVKMEYVGKLKNGKQFDASRGRPFQFKIGRGEVIKGWEIGIPGMKEGGVRRLVIPPEKGYGRAGAPPTIPGNATLIFEVTLLKA